MYYLSMHRSRLRFKDISLSSRFKGFAGLDTTEPSIVTCGSKNVPGKHGHPLVTTSAGGLNHVMRTRSSRGPSGLVRRPTDEWTRPGTIPTPTPPDQWVTLGWDRSTGANP